MLAVDITCNKVKSVVMTAKRRQLNRLCITIATLLATVFSYAQPLIHSHNDYTHALPFWEAYNNNAGIIEADVYEVNGELMVAHDKANIKPGATLSNMYIQPI